MSIIGRGREATGAADGAVEVIRATAVATGARNCWSPGSPGQAAVISHADIDEVSANS